MMIFVETNFVIELAALQEEAEEAEEAELIVISAEKQELKLFIPAFSLTEPFETYARWRKQRNQTRNDFDRQLKQLARSQDYADLVQASQTISDVFSASAVAQTSRLRATLSRLIQCSTILPLNESVITRSIAAQDEFGLEPQDAVVFASVESGLETHQAEGSRIFITKDRSAFATEQVMEHFRNLQCDVIPAIGPAIGVVKRQPAEVADAIQA
ncbi:hypothetical protein [Peristeroidobacter agariperforans]|uniref:hypothetical protein n=1 Tax=Peristeroidobacter agariperforans TaxID=268404 RepID=UPI00101B7C14|nr:hypothetical protein [Peristeroidobacter agariperforans]